MDGKLFEIFQKIIDNINIDSKKGLEGTTAFIILIFSLIFTLVFILPLDFFINCPSSYLYIIVYAVFYLLKIFLFSSDILYYGDSTKNKYTKAFQAYWPSKHIAKKFNLSEKDASYYWFENFFNKWKDPNNLRNCQWERTLKRGYACRLVYYFVRILELLMIISIIFILIETFIPILFKIEVLKFAYSFNWRLSYTILILLLYTITKKNNRISENELTGVWRRYAEINLMHIKWIDDNIKSVGELKNSKKIL